MGPNSEKQKNFNFFALIGEISIRSVNITKKQILYA